MTVVLILNKDDINTRSNGDHYEIVTDNFIINFTPDAVDEFINDVKSIRREAKKCKSKN